MMIGKKGLGEISEIAPPAAFSKGVEWFTEIFFFYFLTFSIVFWELRKIYKAAGQT